jgi:uncharacterized membrane protein YeaQ/YmgE (transglycosylase-associated protein family)
MSTACTAPADHARGEAPGSYHRAVANVGIAALVIASIAGLIALALRVAPGQPRPLTRAFIGLVPGLVGAWIVVALATDAVPDQFETLALPWVVIVVTGGMILITIRNLAGR